MYVCADWIPVNLQAKELLLFLHHIKWKEDSYFYAS